MPIEPQFTCSTCGSSNVASSRFCNNCGAPLGVPASAYAETVTASPGDSRTLEATMPDQLSGQIIDGRYRIEGLIGVGGMGSVYRATRILIGDEVAIKILHSERVADPNTAQRFRREAQAAARLKHPNAVSIYDFGVSSEGLQYLVMELIEGQSLREVMNTRGTLEPTFCAEIISQVCAALDEAHRQQIVHRDIKPDNIILNSTSAGLRVKVLDFGIAKLRDDAASHLTQTGSVMGTPHYMSPEQCLGEELDARADIYSVGIVLYEMLCGRVPFSAPVSTAVVVQHVNQPPPPMRSVNPGVPERLSQTVLWALAKTREARPQTAGMFAQQIAIASATDTPEANQMAATASAVSANVFAGTPSFELPTPQQMAATVHLPSLSGSTGKVIAARATGGRGTVTVPSVKSGLRKIAYVAGAFALLLALAGLIYWNPLRRAERTDAASPGTTADHGETSVPMSYIAGGRFLMGSTELIQGDEDSKPAHFVSVKPFYLDAYEVSCEEYKKCVDARKCKAPANWVNNQYPSGTAHQPVTRVSWEDANAYAAWVGKRLPTEEEWEFAARGPQSLLYPWGVSWKDDCANANGASSGLKDVGSFKCGSPYGVSDMIGNAWEWTSSSWAAYSNGLLANPGSGNEKVIRGGSWESPRSITSAFRQGFSGPGDQTGFRCARDAK